MEARALTCVRSARVLWAAVGVMIVGCALAGAAGAGARQDAHVSASKSCDIRSVGRKLGTTYVTSLKVEHVSCVEGPAGGQGIQRVSAGPRRCQGPLPDPRAGLPVHGDTRCQHPDAVLVEGELQGRQPDRAIRLHAVHVASAPGRRDGHLAHPRSAGGASLADAPRRPRGIRDPEQIALAARIVHPPAIDFARGACYQQAEPARRQAAGPTAARSARRGAARQRAANAETQHDPRPRGTDAHHHRALHRAGLRVQVTRVVDVASSPCSETRRVPPRGTTRSRTSRQTAAWPAGRRARSRRRRTACSAARRCARAPATRTPATRR